MTAALTVAGFDPSGGAGVIADCRVIESFGVASLSVITALTEQSSTGVRSVHPVDPAIISSQLELLFDDSAIGAIKVGMSGGAGQVTAVAEVIARRRPPFVVVDPVLVSTSGALLLGEEGRRTLVERLFPLASLVTPNIPELEALTGRTCRDETDFTEAARRLLAFGAGAVLVKGGHRSDEARSDDLLVTCEGIIRFPGRRVATPHTHGTGCFLSAAIAALMTKGSSLEQAISDAKAALEASLEQPVIAGRGAGYPMPRISKGYPRPRGPLPPLEGSGSAASRSESGGNERSAGAASRSSLVGRKAIQGIYVIGSAELRPDIPLQQQIEEAAEGGASMFQLREKSLGIRKLIELARELQRRAEELGVLFIVNDRVDVALAAGASGVHLGPDDMSPAAARAMLGKEAIIGVSVSDVAEAEAAAPYASYLAVGAIFGSATKHDAGEAVGVERLASIRSRFPDLPIVAIGGISVENIGTVAAAGADAAAVISAALAAGEVAAAVARLRARFDEHLDGSSR